MRVLLTPMEGVLGSLARELLTEVNDYDLCIAGLACVVGQLLPAKVLHRLCPELHNNSRTPSGMLARIQLLGQYPQWLAENAVRAVELDSCDVDLSCGCPSKLVSGSGGDTTLLKDSEPIYRGAKAMRETAPAHLPVMVKVHLGWNNSDQRFEIAGAVQQADASKLVVHGRTKEQGHKAEHINWQAIGEIRQRLIIPVIANGGVWNWQSTQDCMTISGCDVVTIRRSALNIPSLSRAVRYNEPRMPQPEVVTPLQKCTHLEKQGGTGLYHVARIKQWLGYLCKEYSGAIELFQEIRTLNNPSDIARATQAIETTA